MRKFKSKWFKKWAKKNNLNDSNLIQTINDLVENKKGVRLGNNLYKVRVASSGKGKRGSYRTIIVFKFKVRAIFIGGFAKNEKENISMKQLSDFKELAKTYSLFSDEELDFLIAKQAVFELKEAGNE